MGRNGQENVVAIAARQVERNEDSTVAGQRDKLTILCKAAGEDEEALIRPA